MKSRIAMITWATVLFAALLPAGAAHADAMAAPTPPAAVGIPAATAKTANQITISNFTFAPNTLTVPAGATVTWTNSDDTIHRVMVTDLKVKSDALDTGESFSYKFDQPGTYAYFCTMHPMMTGVVVVKAEKSD